MSRIGSRQPVGRPLSDGVVAEAEVRLGHADRQLVEAEPRVELDLGLGLGQVVHAVRAVDARRDGLDLLLDRPVERVEELELSSASARAAMTASASSIAPLPPFTQCVQVNAPSAPASSASCLISSISASVSYVNEFTATHTGTPNSLAFSMCLARFADALLEQRRGSPRCTPGRAAGPRRPWARRRAS